MSFDIVSYAMGRQAGGGSANLQDNRNVNLTKNGLFEILPSSGYDGMSRVTGMVNVPNTYSADDVGKVVAVDAVKYFLKQQDGYLVTITENGTRTYNTTFTNEFIVTVDVPRVGYYSYQTITGTLANPVGNSEYTFNGLLSAVGEFRMITGAFPQIEYDASAIGAGTGFGSLFITNNLIAVGAEVAENTSSAFTMIWDANGLVSAYMEQSGTITDISPYAAYITTTIVLPIKGGASA